LTALLATTGCAISDDPREGGFISGAVNLSTGRYEERVQDKEEQYQQEISDQERLMQQAQELQQERARVKGELDSATRELAMLEASLRRQEEQLRRERRLTAEEESRLREAESKMSGLRVRVAEAQRGEKPLAELDRESRSIRADLEELDSMVELLGGEGI
jgi:chromosome segregation ATPase